MPSDTPTPSPAELQKWKARGGIDLSRIEDPEEKFAVASEIRAGVHETGHKFLYECPLCGNRFANDQEMEPMCTGPSWTDDHEPTVMRYIGGHAGVR